MNLSTITPLLITFNEVANVERVLAPLHWAARIVVVDSGSTDGTVEWLQRDARILLLSRSFDTFAHQCAHGLRHVESQYTLSLDADHVLTPGFLAELEQRMDGEAEGWEVCFSYCINGRPLRASLLPARIALFETKSGVYEDDGHGHRIRIQGRVARFSSAILHDDRKPLERWLTSQLAYSRLEAEKLCSASPSSLAAADRLRRWLLGPVLVAPYCLLVKGLLLDGRDGLAYTLQRLTFEVLLALRLIYAKLKPAPTGL